MGSIHVSEERYLEVDQHPHIGLSTLTYLFEGAIEHKDSTGAHQIIEAGDVGFMSAGSGVAHTERTPEYLKTPEGYRMHGNQIWVAHPMEKKEMKPRFDFIPSNELPAWDENGINFKLVAGSGFGRTFFLPVHSDLFRLR